MKKTMKKMNEIAMENAANPARRNVCLASCRKLLAQIEKTRNAILAEFREVFEAHEHLLHLALNEAEALAWQSGVPQLVFPALAAEKAEAVAAWHTRQQSMQRTDPGLAFAA